MEFFRPTTESQMTKDEMEILQQKQHEYKPIGRQRRIPGHTLFSFNMKTKEIKVAPVEFSKDVDFRTREAIRKPKIVIEKDCIYRQALNKKNFIKRLKREGILL